MEQVREQVIDRLSSGYAEGRFEVEELERRLAVAHAARTPAELDALVTDLVPVTTALVPAQKTRVLFGSLERTGPWTVPQELAARVVCGNLVLDLREAHMPPGVVTIDIRVTMGNVEVIVPPNVTVDVAASAMLGNVEERVERSATQNRLVRIVGRVKLGNLEVETRAPGEGRRDAKRRRRELRRMRRMRRLSDRRCG